MCPLVCQRPLFAEVERVSVVRARRAAGLLLTICLQSAIPRNALFFLCCHEM
jgi:hypothetical protein